VIVRTLPYQIQLVTQHDHAHLAGRIMEECLPLAVHPRRASILLAAAEHDNGWIEEDAAPTVNPDGTVVDFITAPLSVRHGVWPRAIARLARDPWAAALVAQHAVTVSERFRADTEWASFFAAMEAARDASLQASGLPLADLTADYPFVRLADLISLTFCVGWEDEQRFGDWTVRRVESRIVVVPDPFAGKTVPFQVAASEIANRPYASAGELRSAVATSRSVTLEGVVCGG
jgi:hypothetical protein